MFLNEVDGNWCAKVLLHLHNQEKLDLVNRATFRVHSWIQSD